MSHGAGQVGYVSNFGLPGEQRRPDMRRQLTPCQQPRLTGIVMSHMGTNRTMSDDHKAAIAEGRVEAAIVRRYLEALEATKPRRGRRRTKESIEAKLAEIEATTPDLPPAKRVETIQQRMDLEAELESMTDQPDISGLEDEFRAVVVSYSARKGLTYAAWREAGVDAAVLKAAGLSRSA